MGLIELILSRILSPIVNWFSKREFSPKCVHCSAQTEPHEGQELLFLLPIMVNDGYNATEKFFVTQAKKIRSVEEIPAGQRACWLKCYSCPNCHERAVVINDFLHVRGEQLLKGRYVYEYKKFEQFVLEYGK